MAYLFLIVVTFLFGLTVFAVAFSGGGESSSPVPNKNKPHR